MTGKKTGMTRRAFAGAAAGIALGATRLRGLAQQPQMAEQPATPANAKRTSLHQELAFDAAPHRVFHILLDSKEFAAMTGMDATIDPAAGGAFKTFGGLVEGRNIEIISDQRLVQASQLLPQLTDRRIGAELRRHCCASPSLASTRSRSARSRCSTSLPPRPR